jgi:diguanylate cyclase
MIMGQDKSDAWKEKYLRTVADFDEKQKKYRSAIQELRHGMSRITVAADGIDTHLDRQLAGLRRELRDGAKHHTIKKYVEGISGTLLKLDESKMKRSAVIESTVNDILKLLGAFSASKSLNGKIDYLRQAIKEKSAGKSSEKYLEQCHKIIEIFVSELGDGLVQKPEGKKGSAKKDVASKDSAKNEDQPSSDNGFWGRLRGKPESKVVANEVPIEICDGLGQLLKNLCIPEALKSREDDIYKKLESSLMLDDLPEILQEMIALIGDALHHDQRRFEDFIDNFHEQLDDVQGFLFTANKSNDESLKNTCELDDNLRGEVEEMQTNIKSVRTIDAVTAIVSTGLDNIVQQVDKHRVKEEARIKETKEKVTELEGRLKSSEQNSQALMSSLREQKHHALHDSLTKLPNREYYDARIKEAQARFERHNVPVMIVVCDIDHFKSINDTYGHLAGDKVLGKIAEVIRGAIRLEDFVARYGGEEFVLIVENITPEGACEVAEKIRCAIEKTQFHFRGNPVKITASLGVATFKKGDPADVVFERADAALYKAKKTGRNRVEDSF